MVPRQQIFKKIYLYYSKLNCSSLDMQPPLMLLIDVFQYAYQKSILAKWQESGKEFSEQIDYNYHTANLLSLVKVGAKSHHSANRTLCWRPLDSLVLLSFSGILLTAPAGLTHSFQTGKDGHPLPTASGQPAARETLLQLWTRTLRL